MAGTRLIISYDGTNNEVDALALGRVLADAGAHVALAYVRHSPAFEAPGDHDLPRGEAAALLDRGAELYGDVGVERHVVDDRSTPAGLLALSGQIDAQGVVFCSDSHTAVGHISIGNSARRLLEGGPLAVAIAPAGYAQSAPARLARIACPSESAEALATAAALRAATGSEQVDSAERADLIVIGSRSDGRPGCVALAAAAERLIEEAGCPVLLLPAGVALGFEAGD
ncbi:MAG TPA: universal stress protein [Solirubrobacteraceae bacterium]|nr:universal stress protein [Solirubrobacteraceae bacterium]